MQHAVPKPADVWLAPFAISPPGTAEELVRSVVLFNTWEEPPLDVVREAASDAGDIGSVRCEPRSRRALAPAGAIRVSKHCKLLIAALHL